jgi:hypothetical protein
MVREVTNRVQSRRIYDLRSGERPTPVYSEERGTIEVDNTAWVTVANNLVVMGGDTLKFLHEWEEHARVWHDDNHLEREMYHADVARAESSLHVQVKELHELEGTARADRQAVEHVHLEARVELIAIQHEMLDVLKELHDQNKDADGDEEEEEEEEKDEGKGKGKAKE